ncbi:helix-turn-helix transcriptional regulator [Corynebacterium flavescens]|uniref:helix-turn-helix transcriptional regulator n=1 Tax=Corynebacterium flavescens TaxID=28028 RepID=UPI00289BE97D|nr:helix-turn-helix domain-containing protein [Corynebacterium flavescens]
MTTTTPYLSTAEACELLRCDASTLRRYARDNNWDRVRITQRHVLYRKDQIQQHIDKNTWRVG